MQPEFESITPPILVLRDTEAIVAADRSVRAALRGQRCEHGSTVRCGLWKSGSLAVKLALETGQ